MKKGMVEKKEIAELTGIKKDTLYRNLRDELEQIYPSLTKG